MEQGAKRIEQIQVKLIKIAQKKLRLSDEDYRKLIIQFTPTSFDVDPEHPSCKQMTYGEASNLINHFKSLGFKIITKRYGQKKKLPPNVTALVSRQQLAMINHLKEDIKWYTHDGFYRWIKKYLKRDDELKGWTFLIRTSREANAVIEALKGMEKRQAEAKVKTEEDNPLTSTSTSTFSRRDGGMHGGYYRW